MAVTTTVPPTTTAVPAGTLVTAKDALLVPPARPIPQSTQPAGAACRNLGSDGWTIADCGTAEMSDGTRAWLVESRPATADKRLGDTERRLGLSSRDPPPPSARRATPGVTGKIARCPDVRAIMGRMPGRVSPGPRRPGRVRDAFAMATHRITYQGPAALAVSTATAIAEAPGVELISSSPPERGGDGGATVLLRVTVEGSTEAVMAAVSRLGEGLPETASLMVD